jgi:large subunit ribosomal protein L24
MTTRFKAKFNIKKDDLVVVITGENKDLKAPKKVLKVLVDKAKVVVEGVNMVSRHTKPSAQAPQGGIIKKEAPIAISNVMLWDAKAKAATKIKRERKDDKVVRISKKSGEVIK